MDERELAALRARHRQWDITADDRGWLTAVRGGATVMADDIGRLERGIDEHETGRAAR